MEIFSSMVDFLPMRKPKLETLLAPEMRPERVGKRVTAMREALGLTKAQFADSVGIDRSALTRIEKGEEGLGIAKAAMIAGLYDVEMDFTFRGKLSDVPASLRPKIVQFLLDLDALPADFGAGPLGEPER